MAVTLVTTSRTGLVEEFTESSKILAALWMFTAHHSDNDIEKKVLARINALNALPEHRRNYTYQFRGKFPKKTNVKSYQ